MTKVAVIGLGRLGLPLASVLSRNPDLEVVGVDVRAELIANLSKGIVTLREPDVDISRIKGFTTKFVTALHDAKVAFIVVNTPLEERPGVINGLSHTDVVRACQDAVQALPVGAIIVLVSTVEAQPLVSLRHDAKIPDDIQLIYQPQFIALGNVVQDLLEPDVDLYGVDMERSAFIADLIAIWRGAGRNKEAPVTIVPYAEAAITKMALNAWLCQQVVFGCMFHDLIQSHGGNPARALATLKLDRRFSGIYASGAYPFGGPCFPKDILSMAHMAAVCGSPYEGSRYFRDVLRANNDAIRGLASRVSARHPDGKIQLGLVGVSYKPETEVLERSPAVRLVQELEQDLKGVWFWDENVAAVDFMQATRRFTRTNKVDQREKLMFCDVIVLCHDDPGARITLGDHPNLVDPWR